MPSPALTMGTLHVARHEVRRAAVRVAHHDYVGTDTFDGPAGINQRFALLDTRRSCGDQRGHSAQSFGGELERGTRTRR